MGRHVARSTLDWHRQETKDEGEMFLGDTMVTACRRNRIVWHRLHRD